MSDNAEFSVWSNDEIELLDNIDKEIKLINSDSESGSNQTNGESWKAFQKNEPCSAPRGESGGQSRQSDVGNWHQSEVQKDNSNAHSDKLKSHFSSNDVSKLSGEVPPQGESLPNCVAPFNHSNSCMSLSRNEKPSSGSKKYDHVESKVKQYFHDKHSGKDLVLSERSKTTSKEEHGDSKEISKEHYLEELNKRLTRELDEKNALLTKLQENYENLLLKYAEAQNKIDQLRLKSEITRSECQATHSDFKQGFPRTFFQLPLNAFEAERDHHEAWEDGKCQKAIVAPFVKDNYQSKTEARKIDRPSSLPLEPNQKFLEKDAMKAGTPTDSEGVSSVITSMSGHSKILNTLDAQSPNSRDSKLLHYPDRDFILDESSAVNDAFDKVKNWQNSLPPLELIETPETTLYDEPPMHISPSTNYRDLPSRPKATSDEGTFASNHVPESEPAAEGNASEAKDYFRIQGLLPSFARKKTGNTRNDDEKTPNPFPEEEEDDDDIPSACIIQRRRKKPTLLRCSSLPAYEYDSPKSTHRGAYIPPLDLENLTLSDVESSQPEYDYAKGDRLASSSYITSRSGSADFSSQTCRSVNSFRGRPTDYSESPYSARPSFNKSTSITPERCNDVASRFARSRLDSDNLCEVCGEKFVDGAETSKGFPCRSNSYQSFQDVKDSPPRSSDRRGKHPFHRSMSFNSETNSRERCCHERDNCSLHTRRSQDSLDKFDIYASNLKARSQVIMKALAAHVTNT